MSVITIDKPPFNASLAYLERMERRWEDADKCQIEGNVLGYYRCLHNIYLNTFPFFTEDEQDKAEKLSGKIGNELKTAPNSLKALTLSNVEDDINTFRQMLVHLLHKYDVMFLRKTATTWEERLNDDFS